MHLGTCRGFVEKVRQKLRRWHQALKKMTLLKFSEKLWMMSWIYGEEDGRGGRMIGSI